MMSAPAVNSVPILSPAPAVSLALSVKATPASPPVVSKSPISHNHSSPVPLSLVVENKAKTPEKPKDPVPATSNGIEEQPLPPASVAPPTPAPKEPAVPEPADEAPVVPVAVAPPPVNNTEKEAPVLAPLVPAEPEPAAPAPVVEEAEPPPPKPAKPQGAKRRREPAPVEVPAQNEGVPEKKPRRARAPVYHYQSPLPEITTIINRSLKIKDNTPKPQQEKLVIFYKNEFLAVRNAEGGFFLCQTLQNIFRTSHKIRIRWLSLDEKEKADGGGIYTRDFYDTTDFECILTNVALNKEGKNKYKLPNAERDRVENILKRGLDVEKGVSDKPPLTEDHPDGIDISLYRDEAQLKKAKRKRSPVKTKSPKRVKKPSESPKERKSGTKKIKVKAKSKRKEAKKVVEKAVVVDKPKSSRAERNAAREKAAEKEALKVSPPNEKARVVAKILRKNIDASPSKGGASTDKKASKSDSKSTKVAKRDKIDTKKSDKKKGKSTTLSPVVAPATSSKKAAKSEKKGKVEEKRRSAVGTRTGRK